MPAPLRARPSENVRVEEVTPRTGSYYEVPAWGYVDGFEIRFSSPVPHVNAGEVMGFILDHITGPWPTSVQVFVRRRAVETL